LNITIPPAILRKTNKYIIAAPYQIRFLKIAFLLCFILYFTFQIYSYIRFGIPIFAESRLNVYDTDLFSKILKRINAGSGPLLVFFTILILVSHRIGTFFKFYGWCSLTFIVFTSILSGAKSAFLILTVAYFSVALYK